MGKAQLTDSPKVTLTKIRKAREWVAYYHQWRNEPDCRKKLNRWRRQLKKVLAAAAEQKLEVPPDPYAPPPPPPTEEELREAAVEEARGRVLYDLRIDVDQPYWYPWGKTGWSAVVVTELGRIWCSASRVKPRTGEIVSKNGRVRRDRLVRRDPALRGKDRPAGTPPEIVPAPAAPAETEAAAQVSAGPVLEPTQVPVPAQNPEPGVERTPEEEAAHQKRIADIFGTSDSSDIDDW